MAYKITGKVLKVGDRQTITAKNGNRYETRDLVIAVMKFDPYSGEPTEDPTNTPKFTFMGERCNDLDRLRPGMVCTVHFEISGRSYQKDGVTGYINDLRPFKAEAAWGKTRNATEAYEPPMQETPMEQTRITPDPAPAPAPNIFSQNAPEPDQEAKTWANGDELPF